MSDLGEWQCEQCEALLDNPKDELCESCYLMPCDTCGFTIQGCYDCLPSGVYVRDHTLYNDAYHPTPE